MASPRRATRRARRQRGVTRWPLTLRGLGALALALACVVLAARFGVIELVYVGVLMLAIVGASAATLYLAGRRVRVARSFHPDLATTGDPVHVRARVEIRSALPVAQGRWEDRLGPGLDGETAGIFPATVSGTRAGAQAREIEIAYDIVAARRGVRAVGPLTVTSTDPFGLVRRTTSAREPATLTVAPAVVTLESVADLPGSAGGRMSSSTNRLGQGTDNLIPRHYVPGDSMRRIHWRASAHRDELMVRQEEQETTPEAVVVLDRGLARWSEAALRAPGEDERFETAVTATVSVTAQLVREGYHVSILDVDGTPLVDPVEGGDAAGLREMLSAFATVTARRSTDLTDLARLFSTAQTGPLVLITGDLDAADVGALARVPAHSALPVLICVTNGPPAAPSDERARAADTGWRVAAMTPRDDLTAVWSSVAGGGRRVDA
ncbi:DUF58 domain-containing protein [Microbacterium sp. TNHR37B]|uniref:DUF58 domain-containing protein n=1 Tax=Microbacterium sp. TNHR37B TaxID=1775956 RepID=UPI0007B1A7BA|nr:DUF58 domain-containing protein [Microbacterium sp. TNHR37B]KZE91811.1 hypothetical protein AVP41_01359 [Microbacterium sp. TNHR37B]